MTENNGNDMQSRRALKKKKGCVIFAIVAAILCVAAATNPSAAKHKEAVSRSMAEWASAAIAQESYDNPVATLFGSNIAKQFVSAFVSPALEYHDYVFFSMSTMSTMGGRYVSFGVFGHVFTFGRDNVEKIVKASMEVENVPLPESRGATGACRY